MLSVWSSSLKPPLFAPQAWLAVAVFLAHRVKGPLPSGSGLVV